MKLTVQVKLQALPEQAIAAENIRRAAVNQPDVAGVDVSGVHLKNMCAADRSLVTSPRALAVGS